MKSNKSQLQLSMGHSLSVKQLVSPQNKKVQGFDKNTTSTFTSKIDKLKNKPKVEILEDQYIRGLQDEIKYLQLQLKLLQQKDLEKHGQIDQLQKFFGDGIPINENILAIKNGFNNYKSCNQKKIKELSVEKNQRSTLLEGLAQKVEKLLGEVNQNEKENRGEELKNDEEWFKLISLEASLKKGVEKEEDQVKGVKQESRKLYEKIQKITRNKLIQNITIIKYQNCKNNKLNNIKESLVQKQTQLVELDKELVNLSKEEEEKAYIIRLEQQNLAQKKRIIVFERQYDNLKNKIKEKTMDLEQRLKERMAEIQARMDIKNKVDDVKSLINRENGLTVQQVIQYARQKEIQHLKKIIDSNKKTAKYTDHYSTLLSQIQSSIQSLAQRKPQVKSEINAYSQQITKLKKRIQEQKSREIAMHAQLVELQEKFNHTKQYITPLQERTRKNNDQTSAYLEERRRLLEEIKIKQKQLELIFIVKSLSFEQTQISKMSSKNIQDELTNFVKSWEKIQRNT